MDKLKAVLFVTMVLSYTHIVGQIIWLQAGVEDSQISILDKVSGNSYCPQNTMSLINYNHALKITEEIGFSIGGSQLNQCQVFTVFQSNMERQEELIWSFNYTNEDNLLCTDERIVDFTKGKYMNYLNSSPHTPQINSYQHYRNDFATEKLILGSSPSNKEIPVQTFSGSLSELIVFDRVLAPMTKQAVESYLALKYSIPLAEGLDYINEKGDFIWKYEDHKNHRFRIAGIGRNDDFGLYQRQSKSKLEGGELSIALGILSESNNANSSELQEDSYLLWGDDGGNLDFVKLPGQVPRLIRNWRVVRSQFKNITALSLRLRHSGLQQELLPEEYYWLAATDENMDYNIHNTSYFRLSSSKVGLHAENMEFDESDVTHFTFVKAPAFWADLEILGSDCGEGNGKLNINPIGGTSPYTISLLKEGRTITHMKAEGNFKSITDLVAGIYELRVMDSKGLRYDKQVFINNEELLTLDIPSKIIVNEKENYNPLFDLDLFDGYSWFGPDGMEVRSSPIAFHESGIYTLYVSRDNCKAWFEIDVVNEEQNILSTSVSPNPSTGYFRYSARLKEATPYWISISTILGQEIFSKQFEPEKYIEFENYIFDSGVYVITLKSGDSVNSEKLIIEQ